MFGLAASRRSERPKAEAEGLEAKAKIEAAPPPEAKDDN
jgi:hypothetical protein